MNKNYNHFEIVNDVLMLEQSGTQAVRVAEINRDGKPLISVQKWWRRSEKDDWIPGKGLQLKKDDARKVAEAINKAVENIE